MSRWQKMVTSVNYKRKFLSESVFHKDDFESIHFSNKHHKSHVWPKNLKKKKKEAFFATLAQKNDTY